MASLEIILPDKPPRIVKLSGDRAVLGRSPDVSVHIPSTKLSRKHCEIVLSENGKWVLKDLGSSNGTFAEGKQIQKLTLSEGTEFRLGAQVSVVFHLDADDLQAGVEKKQRKPFPQPQPDTASPSASDEIGNQDDLYMLAGEPTPSVTQEDDNELQELDMDIEDGKCPSCGEELAQGAVICIHCGLNLSTGQRLSSEVEASDSDEFEEEGEYEVRHETLAKLDPSLPFGERFRYMGAASVLGFLAFAIGTYISASVYNANAQFGLLDNLHITHRGRAGDWLALSVGYGIYGFFTAFAALFVMVRYEDRKYGLLTGMGLTAIQKMFGLIVWVFPDNPMGLFEIPIGLIVAAVYGFLICLVVIETVRIL
jgi:pSer/pThr/pTyr-binding forkhead associated (FHA) protein